MKYLNKSFTLAMGPTPAGTPKRAGRTTYIYCTKCEKVHEVGKHTKKRV